eukprot:194778-Pleurochrysis_carterae.AAC.1
MDPGAQYQDLRGKHDRTNVQKTVAGEVTAANHMARIRKASLLRESRCSNNCARGGQCMLSAFTVTTLRICAAVVFGDSVLDGTNPPVMKQWASHI